MNETSQSHSQVQVYRLNLTLLHLELPSPAKETPSAGTCDKLPLRSLFTRLLSLPSPCRTHADQCCATPWPLVLVPGPARTQRQPPLHCLPQRRARAHRRPPSAAAPARPSAESWPPPGAAALVSSTRVRVGDDVRFLGEHLLLGRLRAAASGQKMDPRSRRGQRRAAHPPAARRP